jgi:predicted nucleic acid-binding protein
MSDLVIFDTSVLVDDLRTGRYRRRIETLDGLLRNSAVVLAELSRGIANRADREFLRVLGSNHPILTPTERNWLESGEILGDIQADRGYTAEKLRDLHFDVLIALTARSHGARLITTNHADFELIASYRKFQLEIWWSGTNNR